MKLLNFYPRLSRFVVSMLLVDRAKDLRALVLFGKFVIIWDAPEKGAGQ